MPPREFQTPAAKRDELKTYRELTLGRQLKSERQRRKLESAGQHRVLGNGSGSQPYLVVPARRYREVRLEIQRQLLQQARQTGLNLPVDTLLRQLRPRVEEIAYLRLAEEVRHEAEHQAPLAALGRSLTSEERTHFAASRVVGENSSSAHPAKTSSSAALHQVLGRIEKRQTHNPARYQTLWAQLVGPDAAQQSCLEHVDPATCIAYFRCYNSVLSADLQRRPGLAAKLAKVLGVPVRQLRAKF
jgi:hypothetical protein